MDRIANSIASNAYLQAVAIVITIVGAIFFFWKNRRPISHLLGSMLYFISGKIWIPIGVTAENINIGIRKPSFLIAVLAKHAVTIFLCSVGWYFCREVNDGLAKLSEQTNLVTGVRAGFVLLLNVLALVAGARLGEISVIAKAVMRRIKEEEKI